ncbi:MAG: hypothetical protein NTX91_02510 [candidate division SR1 bacterium]|nr:hypothetical protein [candidate division SR1 bacterium]
MTRKNISKITLLATVISGACILAGCGTSVAPAPQQRATVSKQQMMKQQNVSVNTTTRAS